MWYWHFDIETVDERVKKDRFEKNLYFEIKTLLF